MTLSDLALYSFVFLFCCMLLRFAGSPWTRPARVHIPVTPRTSRTVPLYCSSAGVQARRLSMFKKAVDAHVASTSNASRNILEKEICPSSSPVQDAVGSSGTRQLNHAFKPPSRAMPLDTTSSSVYNSIQNQTSLANKGIKRTANGLAKSLYGTKNTFQEPQAFASKAAKSSATFHDSAGININDDDIDSDIDFDAEDSKRLSAATVKYPNLSSQHTRPATATVQYPPLKRAGLHTQASAERHSPPAPTSSEPIPWSSSPSEHLFNKPVFQRPNVYLPPSTSDTSSDRMDISEGRGPSIRAPKASKRRTLPWLEKHTEHETETQTPKRHAASVQSKSGLIQTQAASPLPRGTPGTFPWDTTASAVKEKQKHHREALRESALSTKRLKSEIGTGEGQLKALSTIKKPAKVSAPCLSTEQRKVLELVIEHSESVFFTGSAGTGKSVLLREIISVLRKKFAKEADRIAVTASTGLAACNVGGVTLHSFAGIGLGKEDVDTLLKKIKRNQKAKHRWMRTKILIVDEVSMVDGELFDKLEEIGRRLRNNGRPFGGIQLVITGDFFQLPPVPDYGKPEARFCFDAHTWSTVVKHTIALHHVFRQRDQSFADMLNEMRLGKLSTNTVKSFRSLDRPIAGSGPTTELFPRRQDVDAANNGRMSRLAGDMKRFEARDGGTIVDKAARDKLLQNCMAPETLELKKGAQVMLIKNIDETLVNGSLGQVIAFMDERMFDNYNENPTGFASAKSPGDDDDNSDVDSKKAFRSKFSAPLLAGTSNHWPVVRFQLADGTTRDLLCQREVWKVELPNGEVQASRAQIPLILAWALSIHKAQGQTLERVKVDLTKVFEKGQAYVALSRATNINGLQVIGFNPDKVLAHSKVRMFYAGLSRADGTAKALEPE